MLKRTADVLITVATLWEASSVHVSTATGMSFRTAQIAQVIITRVRHVAINVVVYISAEGYTIQYSFNAS